MSKNLNVISWEQQWYAEPCIFIFFGVVSGAIFVKYISMAFTVACLCSATALHNSEHKEKQKVIFPL